MTAYEFYRNILHITNEELIREFADVTQIKILKKGEFVVHMGEVLNDVCFMETGIARGYFLDANGKEVTDCFSFKCGSAVMPNSQLEMDIPSHIAIEMLEDAKLFCIPLPAVLRMKEKYIEITTLYNQMLIKAMEEHWKVKKILNSYTAVQRYQWFLQEYSELLHRVSDKYIASFLGMTPVTLSRLRRTLKEDANDKKNVRF